jgi:hypothetical protein
VKNGSEAGSLPPALGTEQLVSAVPVARPHATVRYHASRDQPSRSIDNPTLAFFAGTRFILCRVAVICYEGRSCRKTRSQNRTLFSPIHRAESSVTCSFVRAKVFTYPQAYIRMQEVSVFQSMG